MKNIFFVNKRITIFILFILIASIITGCSANSIYVNTEQNSNGFVEIEDYQNYLDIYSGMAKADNGYYFISNSLLHYFDISTSQSYPVCSKTNCEHNSDTCTAFLSSLNFYPVQLSYYNNALYLLGWEQDGANIYHNYIYQISLDNFKRKKAAYLFDSNGLASVVFMIHRGYVYFSQGNLTMKENTVKLNRTKLGNTKKNDSIQSVFEFTGIGSTILGLSAYGNHVFLSVASYADEKGNGYNSSLESIDIHTLKSKSIIENNMFAYFANGEYLYYEKNENTVNRVNLNTGEDKFFCNIKGPCYISGDDNYLYFDNQQSIFIDENITDRNILVIDKKTGKPVSTVIPKNISDECLFGGNDLLIFKGISEEDTDYYYAYSKAKLPEFDNDFIDMN